MLSSKRRRMLSCTFSFLGVFVIFFSPITFARGKGGRHMVVGHSRRSGGKRTHVKRHSAKNPKPHDIQAHIRRTKGGNVVPVRAHRA